LRYGHERHPARLPRLATHAEDELVHAQPFEVFGLELGVLWQR
jgi:hypothetical protein